MILEKDVNVILAIVLILMLLFLSVIVNKTIINHEDRSEKTKIVLKSFGEQCYKLGQINYKDGKIDIIVENDTIFWTNSIYDSLDVEDMSGPKHKTYKWKNK